MPSAKYDVALSFASEDGAFAMELAARLRRDRLVVFNYLDDNRAPARLDDPLFLERFRPIYTHESRCVVYLMSRSFLKAHKKFTRWELSVRRGLPNRLSIHALIEAMPVPINSVMSSHNRNFCEYYDLVADGNERPDFNGLCEYVRSELDGKSGGKGAEDGLSGRRILMISPEYDGFQSSGGLGTATAGLARALAGRGHEVRVLLPSRCKGRRDVLPLPYLEEGCDTLRLRTRMDAGVKLHWLENQLLNLELEGGYTGPLVSRPFLDFLTGPSAFPSAWSWMLELRAIKRFADFAIAFISRLAKDPETRPHVIHLHDWTAAYLAARWKYLEKDEGRRIPTVLTVHNASHPGALPTRGPAGFIFTAMAEFWGIGKTFFRRSPENCGSLLELGIANADLVTTVSQGYAARLTEGHPHVKREVTGLIREKGIIGITNGVDYSRIGAGAPLPACASPGGDAGTSPMKAELQYRLARLLRVDLGSGGPLIIFLNRLDEQKGIHELVETLEESEGAEGCRVLIMGATRDARLRSRLLGLRPPAALVLRWLDPGERNLALQSADAVFMPSHYEPCGLTHLEAMRFGAIPVASRVDGLADTVIHHGMEGGYGIWVPSVDSTGIRAALKETATLFAQSEKWSRMRQAAMSIDHSWSRPGGPAERYEQIFRSLPSEGNPES